ncbi:Thioredoxin- transmembrane protein 2 [Apophysomyces sp. BC1034]|nr:Thioredoxin- transmembrane protein 2 [Apophysomyces sp. BC1015]KAG0181571.1 Thioredoxin- transmembrane protein 2 [Apophysomyces sp. BC1021]KAG0192181.1 Thioredoxin- transmembrane protein 2 [Apophysomyces sp. BC1034]
MTSLAELRQRLIHPYYVLHFLYGSFYIAIQLYHQFAGGAALSDNDFKAYCVLIGLSTWKSFMASTAEELASVLILYSKFFTLCHLYFNTGMFRVILYVAGWMLLSTFYPQPWYRGPTNIIELSEQAFKTKVLRKKRGSARKIDEIKGPRIVEVKSDEETAEEDEEIGPKYWIVMLYANWSVSCLNFEGVLAKLSIKYHVDHIKFAKLDVDVFSDVAQEYGVSRDPASFDLPTLLLFQNGTEIRRLPELTISKTGGGETSKTNAAKDTITRLGWSKKPATVIKMFQLDEIAAEKH